MSDAWERAYEALDKPHTSPVRERQRKSGFRLGYLSATEAAEARIAGIADRLDLLANMKRNSDLPKGTRDDRCRGQGMTFAYGLSAKMVRTLLNEGSHDV